MDTAFAAGATSKSVYLRGFTASTGLPYTAGAYNTSGITAAYVRTAAASASITLATQTASGAYSSGGFVHIAGGLYRLDVPNAALNSGVDAVDIVVYGITDVTFEKVHIDIIGQDPRAATVDANVTQISGDAGAADNLEAAFDGTGYAGGTIKQAVNVAQWSGTNVAGAATAGYPVVTVKVGTGTGELNVASGKAPATIAAGDLAANAVTASALATDAVTEIANATVEAELTALQTYNRSSNTAGTITGPTSGSNALGITTDATYQPIKSIT